MLLPEPGWPRILRGEDDTLVAEDGRRFIDLFSAHGAAWLGHANKTIGAAVAEQLERVWLTGGLPTRVAADARELIEAFFPPALRLAGLWSTGMEAAEFAIRVARVATGRRGLLGFAGSMHGKSLATALLGWDNRDGLCLPGLHRLPFPEAGREQDVLAAVERALSGEDISAVFLEPIQASHGGRALPAGFCREVARLARARGTLVVFDEILTGFHRTGPAFAFEDMNLLPDAVLIGKALGNGFPVSAVLLDRAHPVVPAMLPGSTYAGNPLASAAVCGTLREMRRLDLPARVAAIAATVGAGLEDLRGAGIPVRGRGALWVLELPASRDAEEAVLDIYRWGVCVGHAGRYIRLLPPATIGRERLAQAVGVVRGEVRRVAHGA